jgi:hypothetical protein
MFSGLSLVSCSKSLHVPLPPSRISTRVMASQDVSAGVVGAGLFVVNAELDTLARAAEISGGTAPGIMAISPNRATLIALDTNATTTTLQLVDTTKESNIGSIGLPGVSTSVVMPLDSVAYAAVPGILINGYPAGGIEVLNLTAKTVSTIGVPNAQTVVASSNGTQLLVFTNDPNSVSVISPLLATPPVDQGCNNHQPNPVCTVVSGFDYPVFAVVSGTTAYVLNCGPECGGTQASVQTLDLGTLAVGTPIPVEAATMALLSGTTLYVAGTPPGANTCAGGPTTNATKCGRLSIVDLGSMTQVNAAPIYIPDGYHDLMDLSLGGQLFIGSHDCTEIGNVVNPSGEVRGCLAIFDTTKAGNTAPVIPPDNGDVTGLQGFTTRYVEYVAEGGNLRVYDTTQDKLLLNSIIPTGTIGIVGYVVDVKAVDFF